jgi:hypothetical protein
VATPEGVLKKLKIFKTPARIFPCGKTERN